ncbi:MAG: OmpH family outer membrane protein [Veillonella sp.]|nr:OmpH family outer membrane protein [Veillonella sp.]
MKRVKALVLGAVMVGAMGLMAGCGSDTVGYVDVQKVSQQSQKMQDVTKEMQAKNDELTAQLNAINPETNPEEYAQKKQELSNEFRNFQQAKDEELENYFREEVGKVAKQEGASIVLVKGDVVSGGVDLTDKVLDAIGRVDPATANANANAAATTGANAGAATTDANK